MKGKARIRIVTGTIEGSGPAVLDAVLGVLQAFESAVNELPHAPKRVPSPKGGKPLGMERPKRPRRNRSI